MMTVARPLGVMRAPLRYPPPRLAQAPALFKVVVTDVRGTPFRGIRVSTVPSIDPAPYETTDASGTVSFMPPPAAEVTVRFEIGGLVTTRRARTDETLFVEIPICAPAPFLTKTEIISLLLGGVIGGAGFVWKTDVLKVVGEVVFGAAAFTAIYRHSCNW